MLGKWFNRKPEPEDPSTRLTNLLMSYATLLAQIQRQIEWNANNRSLPIVQIYLSELIQLNVLALLGGDPVIIGKLHKLSTAAMEAVCMLIEESGKDLKERMAEQFGENPDGPSKTSQEIRANFEDIMKGLNIPGINVDGTGVSKDNLNKKVEEKTKQVDDLKKKTTKKRKPKTPPEDKKDENKEKDNPSGDKTT